MPLPPLLRFLYPTAADGVADAELLRRFAAGRDEAAFELLVRRHAELVWKVCRGVLRQDADAEDAFQAAFLALARKAGSVRGRCVAGWLHRVAVHAALKLRARRTRLPPADPATLQEVPAPPTAAPDPELAAVLHDELARLGERYRLPVLLCDLEGYTHAAAAAQLGWPVGTVSGRLSRARDHLRRRLERRGLAPAAAILGPAAPPPPALVRTSAAVGAGMGPAPPAVVSLTDGVLTAMRAAKLKLVVGVSVVVAGLLGSGTFVGLSRGQVAPGRAPTPPPAGQPIAGPLETKPGDEPPVAFAFPDLLVDVGKNPEQVCPHLLGAKPVEIAAGDSPLQKAQKARLREIVSAVRVSFGTITSGWGADGPAMQRLADVLGRLPSAVADVEPTAEGRRAWFRERVLLTRYVERAAAERYKNAGMSQDFLHLMRILRLEAEIDLLKLQQAAR